MGVAPTTAFADLTFAPSRMLAGGTARGAKQDDAGLSIRSASVAERLPHGFGPMLCPLDLDSVLRAQAIDVTTRGEMLLMRSKGYIKS
jgi:hypothetical protein